MTTKMQREVYQGKLNQIFRRQINFHLGQDIETVRDLEAEPTEDLSNAGQHVLLDQNTEPEILSKKSTWCVIEDPSLVKNVLNLKQIPDYEKLLTHKLP